MNKLHYTWAQFDRDVCDIATQLHKDLWMPDYVVGITRGGLPLAAALSNRLGVRCETLKVSLRDEVEGCESNLWMAEDAFGYVPQEEQEIYKSRWDISRRAKILIVDDINDSGATLNWIMQDWPSGCLPKEKTAWESVWGNNVRFATLFNNEASEFQNLNYHCHSINKFEDDVWIVFPWEEQFLELKQCT